METRETAVIYSSWVEAMRELPPADFKATMLGLAGMLFRDEQPADLPPIGKCIATLAAPIIRKNKEKWQARKEAGRPALPVTAEDARNAVERAGTVKAAAEQLGISVKTLYRRLSVSKCQNVKSVNVNVNENVNVNNDTAILTRCAKIAEAAEPPKPFNEALACSPQGDKQAWQEFESEEAQQKAQELFDSMKRPFRKKGEQKAEEPPKKEERNKEELAPSPAELPDYIESLAEEATAKAETAESDSAQSLYEGEAQAFSASAEMIKHGASEETQKQLKWRKYRAFERRGRHELDLQARNAAEGEFRAYSEVLDLLAMSEDTGEKGRTAYNACYVGKKAGGPPQELEAPLRAIN